MPIQIINTNPIHLRCLRRSIRQHDLNDRYERGTTIYVKIQSAYIRAGAIYHASLTPPLINLNIVDSCKDSRAT